MTVPGLRNAQVLLKYHHKFFNVGWGITNTPWHIYRMLTQFANFLEVGYCIANAKYLSFTSEATRAEVPGRLDFRRAAGCNDTKASQVT